ncbi:hypothetical protein LA52FAK_03220 [Desulforhopalus sp. 52FAK]
MAPVVAILLYSAVEHKKLSVADAERDIFLMTSSMAEVQKDLTHSVRQTLTVLSLLAEVQSFDREKSSTIFKSIVSQNPEYYNISLVALDGSIIASAKSFSVDTNLSDRKHIQDAIADRRFSIGEFIVGRAGENAPVFSFAYPVFDQELQLVALLAAAIRLDYFTKFHEFAEMPAESFISVTDYKGVRLFYYPPQSDTNPIGKPIKRASWIKAQTLASAELQGSFVSIGSDGVKRIFAFERVGLSKKARPYMYVWAGIPEEDVLRPARKALVRNMIFLIASIALALLVFLLVGKKILIEPINRLVSLTQKFAEGEFTPCVEPSRGPRELQVLNNAFFEMATDLSESQRTVRDSEDRFREIFNNMTNGVVIFTPIDGGDDFVVKDINPAGLKQAGFSREELIGRSVSSALPDIFDTTFLELLQRVYLNESTEYYPVSKYENEQVQLWIESYIFSLPVGEVVVVYTDITERKQIEDERLKSEVKFRAVIDHASDAIYLVDENGEILLVNKRACESMGYTEEEFLQMSIAEIDPHFSDRSDIEKIWRPLVEGKTHIIETEHRDKAGRVFPVEVNLGRITTGNKKAYLGIIRDLSARKEFEASLKRSKEEWENTFNAMSDIITIQDRDMSILRANKAFHDTFPEYDNIKSAPPCYEIFHSDKQICSDCPAQRTLADGATHREEVFDELTGKTCSVVTCPILDENGDFEHLVHIVKDITESKKLEDELFQSHKMEAVGTLAGGIAHDFNNILSAIMGFAEFIKEDVPVGSQIGQDADEILSATNRAKDLVKQILTFSRKSDHKKEVVEPHLVVQEAVSMLQSTFPTSLMIVEDIQTDCCPIHVNSTNLHQVVINLCANARHAMEDDKGVLRVELKDVSRRKSAIDSTLEQQNYVVLRVIDNGCGMAPEDLERIFEPYYTTREVGSGSGLGLSVTHGIVEDCNGFVEVESEPGEGTAFSVYFPCYGDETITHDTAGEGLEMPVVGVSGGRILMVDDEPALLKINTRRFEGLGYDVVVAHSGSEALKLIYTDSAGFDLLITDQTMPELTGEELAREVLLINDSLPIIICTGHSESFSKEQALAMGVKKYILKPILGNDLIDAVRDVLGPD